jgi:hypothetical protein
MRQNKGGNGNGNTNNNNIESEKIYLVYKFIHTPIDALIAGM